MLNQSSSHIVIFDKENKVLLLKRAENDEWEPGKWSIPGGRREKDETLHQNIVREVAEETGLTVYPQNIKFLSKISHKLNHIFFTTKKFDGKITLDHENSDYVWVKPEEIDDKLSVPNLREEVMEAKKLFASTITIKVTK